jgi:glycosyltransferase involved in cell wall biosynthesis
MISILTPIYNVDVRYLDKYIKSVKSQSFKDWELCLINDGSKGTSIINYLSTLEKENNPKIKIKNLENNSGIGIATQKAFEMSSGEYIAFADNDDILHVDALKATLDKLIESDADLVYSDEATINAEDRIIGVHYKPDFSMDHLMSQNYMCHFVLTKRTIYEKVGGVHSGFDGSQDHDFLLRITDITNNIVHIPEVLYYWRITGTSASHTTETKMLTWENGKKAIKESLIRKGIEGDVLLGKSIGTYKVKRKLLNLPLISIIIPFGSNTSCLKKCVSSIKEVSSYKNYEIIVIVSKKEDVEQAKTVFGINKIVGCYNDLFNYYTLINSGVQQAMGEHIIIMHDDTFPKKTDWMETLLEQSQRKEVGVVGGKIYNINGTVQQAGLVTGEENIANATHVNIRERDLGYMCRAIIIQNTSIVNDICMIFKKTLFDLLNGFNDLNLSAYYGDIDFCLRARENKYVNVFMPDCEIFHIRRKTIKNSYSIKENNFIFNEDKNYIKSRHSKILCNGDPYYNVNLSKDTFYTYPIPNRVISTDIILNKQDLQKEIKENKNKITKINNLRPLVSFIVPSCSEYYSISILSILAQTYDNFEIIYVHDGLITEKVQNQLNNFEDDRIKVFNTPQKSNDWGHTPRAFGLEKVSPTSDLVVFTGGDNYYTPKFLEFLVPAFYNKEIVGAYCDCLHNYLNWEKLTTQLTFGKIDCGCFMVKTDIAKNIGWKYRVSESDWLFINEVIRNYKRSSIVKIDKILFVHN